MRRAGSDDVVGEIRPAKAGYAGRPRAREPHAAEAQALLEELWQISHLGWIPEAAILRSLTIAVGQEIPAAGVPDGLGKLLERGWAEQRDGDAGTGDREWRLTDNSRNAR